ncbi:MAG: LysM peptidoglycan-binding domain-containing protein [Myxococcales bacterium]|nr:LysM peptidoglycan-binding domain-containing protein [Myxococcales bacterium]MCB9531487.1 LysM peptidoglycan-binding domain-containing protein [Myxococcales bacterium]
MPIAECTAALAIVAWLGGCHRDPEPAAPPAPTEEPTALPVEEPLPPPPEPTVYTVVAGDSLWLIGTRTGCSVDDLKLANGLGGDTIRAGQTLTIPVCEADPEPELSAEGSGDAAPLAEAGVYAIRAGDTLERIASSHGCSVSEIMTANGMVSDSIYAGRSLQIPACTGVEVAVAPAADGGGDGDTYRVRSGDNVGLIASRFGCSTSEFLAANSRSDDRIQAGELLRVPSDCTGAPAPGVVASGPVDHATLPRLLAAHGFRGGSSFKAVVVEVTFDSARRRVVSERRFDYNGTGDDVTGWNPASTVKLFAGIAAAQRARDLGVGGDAMLTYHSARDRQFSLDELLEAALGPSDNIAYNRLVQFVGYDAMNEQFLSRANGFRHTALRRPYARSEWMAQGEPSSFRETPAISIREGGRRVEVPARVGGTAGSSCGGSACTTLFDLAEAMRRLMLQEQLPTGASFDLPASELRTIRRILRTDRARGEEVVDRLARDFRTDARFYHKAGFSEDWYSDNVYIYDPSSSQAWIVAMTNHPGRSSLNSAAEAIGAILSSGELRRAR